MNTSPLLRQYTAGFQDRFWKHGALSVFWVAFGLAFLCFLPSLIMGKGLFTFYGDYVVQQIPFYKHCHLMVRSGNFLWDWGTDFGANFIGSYSFYLLGSPFFWLTLPFPNAWVPYLMAPLFFIKFGTAAATSFLYIKRFTAKQEYAFIGALLYAFSGFQIYNIFFNHFHDVVALFPLLLIGMEELIVQNKKGLFAFAVAITACCNYFFFVGEVVFLLLYFMVRCGYCHSWRLTLKKFFMLAGESILGVCMAGIILLPSFFAVISNPRVGGMLSGYNMLFYGNPQRYAAILQCFLFPADLPSRVNFFTEASNKWTSMAGWLPLFGMTGVFAYLLCKRRTWLKAILCSSIVMMVIPVLNSAFVALNSSYYCRWYFMPVLMMALGSVLAMEDPRIDYMRGFKLSTWLTALMVVCVGFIPKSDDALAIDEELTGFDAVSAKLTAIFTNGGLYEDAERFWLWSAIALISLVLVYLLIKHLRNSKHFIRITAIALSVIILVSGTSFILLGRAVSGNHDFIRNDLVNARLELPDDPEEQFFRIDFPDSFDNVGIYWNYPQITTFHSIVPTSIMEFYPVTGTDRNVGSRPELDLYGVRALGSCKYYFKRGTDYDENDPPMPGYLYRFTSHDMTVWENKYYIPMGFTYDYSVSRDDLETYDESDRDKIMLHALCLSDDDLVKYRAVLTQLTYDELPEASEQNYYKDCLARRATACSSFAYSSSGFDATITTEKDELVFFSVPYEEGWRATVNGQDAEIVVSNIGFMSVLVPAGTSNIEFHYMTPGLPVGIIVSIVAVLLFVLYLLLNRFLQKRRSLSVPLASAGKCAPLNCAECKRCFRKEHDTLPIKDADLPDPFTALTLEQPGEVPINPPEKPGEQPQSHKEAAEWLEAFYSTLPDDEAADVFNEVQEILNRQESPENEEVEE